MSGSQGQLGPDFVCIGAQKAGTTWIYDCLERHDGVWLPPVKEIHYFELVCPNEELLGIEADKHPSFVEKFMPLASRPSIATLRWLHRFYFRSWSTEWYMSLFPSEEIGSRKSGDITPAYSTLDERGVGYARRILKPGCKVFLIVRNPVDRIWSSLKMFYRWQQRDIASEPAESILKMADLPIHRLRTDYERMIPLWRGIFEDDFEVFLYDDLEASPVSFINKICAFIGLEELEESRVPRGRANADPAAVRMPRDVREQLAQHYQDSIHRLDALMPGVASKWAT